jgi:hypothetical protein
MKASLGKKILSGALCVPLVGLTTPIDSAAAMQAQTTASPHLRPIIRGKGPPKLPRSYRHLSLPSHSIQTHWWLKF